MILELRRIVPVAFSGRPERLRVAGRRKVVAELFGVRQYGRMEPNTVAIRLVTAHVAQMKLAVTPDEIAEMATKPYWLALARAAIEGERCPRSDARTALQEEHFRQAQALGDP